MFAYPAALALVIIVFVVTTARPSRYDFLNRFHPRHVTTHSLIGREEVQVMLVFPKAEADQILSALQDELRQPGQFEPEAEKAKVGSWTFNVEASTPGEQLSEMLRFESGSGTRSEEYDYERGLTGLHRAPREEELPPPCCLVFLPPRDLTWIERQWNGLKSFLRL